MLTSVLFKTFLNKWTIIENRSLCFITPNSMLYTNITKYELCINVNSALLWLILYTRNQRTYCFVLTKIITVKFCKNRCQLNCDFGRLMPISRMKTEQIVSKNMNLQFLFSQLPLESSHHCPSA